MRTSSESDSELDATRTVDVGAVAALAITGLATNAVLATDAEFDSCRFHCSRW